MGTGTFRQAVLEVLAERWHAGHRAIDCGLLRELLLRDGYCVSAASLNTLLQEWQARELLQLGTVHAAGPVTRHSCTVLWISNTLLASAWAVAPVAESPTSRSLWAAT